MILKDVGREDCKAKCFNLIRLNSFLKLTVDSLLTVVHYVFMTLIMISLLAFATQQHNLPAGLLQAVCTTESQLDPNAVHQDDGGSTSLGLCQVKLTTAQWLGFQGTEQDLMEPSVNAYYAAQYLHKQLIRYNENIPKALTAYNRGNAIGIESSEYSDKVLKQWYVIGGNQWKQ